MSETSPQISDRRRITEITFVFLTGAGKFIFMDWLQWKLPFILIAIIGWTAYVVLRRKQISGILRYWGFRADNFKKVVRMVLPFGIISVISFFLIGFYLGSINITWHIIPILILYPVWGIVQQFLVIGIVAGNLKDLNLRKYPNMLIIFLTAVLFGSLHYPIYWLIIGTFVLALFYGYIYLKERNVYVLGIFHGWLGGLFFYTVVGRIRSQKSLESFVFMGSNPGCLHHYEASSRKPQASSKLTGILDPNLKLAACRLQLLEARSAQLVAFHLQAAIQSRPMGLRHWIFTNPCTTKLMSMKKTILTLLAGLAIAVSASAQTNFGAKAGLNFFKLSTDADESTDMMTGVHLGFLAHIHMSETFALQPELVYSMQGANFNSDGVDGEFHLNYINIPLMFQYMFDNGFRLQAGPQIGILASAKAKSGSNDVDVKDQFNSLDFGIPFGVGYVFPSGFGLDARYNLGISNVFETDDVKAQNRGFQLGVFYLFTHN